MSDIKIEVGQVWRGNRTGTTAAVVAGIDGFKHALALPGGPVAIRDEDVIRQNWTLVSAPTQARSGCKSFCGKDGGCAEYQSATESTVFGTAFALSGWETANGDGRRWCTALCRDERRPPLPASSVAKTAVILCQDCEQPMKFIGKGLYECRCDVKPARPKEAAAPKTIPPKCHWRHATTPCSGTIAIRYIGIGGQRAPSNWCEGHMMEYERQAGAGEWPRSQKGAGPGLAASSLPERLEKPKLAVDWIWDTLPEAGR